MLRISVPQNIRSPAAMLHEPEWSRGAVRPVADKALQEGWGRLFPDLGISEARKWISTP